MGHALLDSLYIKLFSKGNGSMPCRHSQFQDTSYLLDINFQQVIHFSPIYLSLRTIQILLLALLTILSVFETHFRSDLMKSPRSQTLSTTSNSFWSSFNSGEKFLDFQATAEAQYDSAGRTLTSIITKIIKKTTA